MKISKYNLLYDLENGDKIIYNTRTLGLAVLEKKDIEVLNNIEEYTIENSVVSDLYESGFVIDKECDEIKILKHRLNLGRYNADVLSLVIAPTFACNFKCGYCYEKNGVEKCENLMSEDVYDALVLFVEKKLVNIKKLDVVWYGGEPLIAIDLIEKLTNKFISLCEKVNVEYECSMITNGYLLDKIMIERIERIGVNTLQITLDGTKEVHDKRRMLKNGLGTHDKILENIRLCNNKFNIFIRANIDYMNCNYINKLIDEIKKMKMNNIGFSIAKVLHDDSENTLNDEEFSRIWIRSNDMCDKVGIKREGYCLSHGANYCDADRYNSFVIDCEGFVYKCWHDIGDKKASIGNLCNGLNYSKLFYEYMVFDATEDEKCKECKLLPLCMGGCPYERIHNKNKCSMYKFVIEDIIRRLARQ